MKLLNPAKWPLPKKSCAPFAKHKSRLNALETTLVMLADMIQKVAKGLMLPTALSAVIGCFYSGFLMYGLNTMDLIFGQLEARRLLMPSTLDLRARNLAENSNFWKGVFRFFKLSDPFMPLIPGLKLCLGLPLIAPSLILARTRLADRLFAILPISYFVFNSNRRLDLESWPPSPALTLAVLPYIRTTYNELYKYTISDLEKHWDTAVQRKPREGETAEQIAAEQAAQEEERGFLDIEVELVEHEEAMPEEDIPQAGEAVPARIDGAEVGGLEAAQGLREQLQRHLDAGNPLNDEDAVNLAREGLAAAQALRDQLQRQVDVGNPLNDADARQLEEAVRDARREVDAIRERLEAAGHQLPHNGRRRRNDGNGREIRQNVSTTQIASTVMGALFFPAISSLMGDFLKFALPAKWVTKQSSGWGVKVSNGMLKEKWGRSIIGGCLFVVLKDAVTLYCKWKKARDFGKKRILDYVGERKHA